MNAQALRLVRDQELRLGHTHAHRAVRLLVIASALGVLGFIALRFGGPDGYGGIVLAFLPARWAAAILALHLATAAGALVFALLDLAALHRARIIEHVVDTAS